MLLAGGQGSRLGVLTSDVAKPAVAFGGKYRIIDFPLSNCINSGIDTVGVLTQYQPLRLNTHIGIGIPWDLDRNNGGVTVLPPYERSNNSEWYTGTANAIYQNLRYMESYNPEYVLILSGDHIYKMDYEVMLDFHKANHADVTIATMPVSMEEASRFGIVIADENKKIQDFEEKPEKPRSNLASMGIYIFSWKVLRDALIELKDQQSCDFGKHIIPYCFKNNKRLFAYEFNGYWKDVGTLGSYWEANMELIDLIPEFNLYEEFWKIYTKCDTIEPQYIAPGAKVERCIIGEAAEIHGAVINSVIGPNVYIGPGAVVRDSIIMKDTSIGRDVTIDKSIIAENCRIEDGVTLGIGEAAPNKLNESVYSFGLVTIGDDSVVPENVKVGKNTAISGVSMEGAAKNLQAEVPENDFDKYLAETKANWNRQLGKIEIKSDNENDKVNFYTALYHSMIAPTIYSDVDGAYYGPNKKVHQADGWVNYSTFSLWDTYRAAHPLFTYTEPERVNDMVKSFIAFYEQNGRLPVWNFYGSETDMMIGYHAVPVIVDAYLKGIGDFDAKKALDACIATANLDNYRGIGLYKELGYIPYNVTDHYNAENWSLSKTLEYAFDDYCIAEMAKKMGKQDIADEFYKRSQNYKNVYNPATSFMQPRDDKGIFIKDFKADDYTPHICESNGWQYFWSVQHDINGLIDLVGGKNRFAEKLDSMFTYHPAADDELPIFSTGMIGQYAHGNEPSHHVIYLFNAIGHENRTQEYVAKVMNELYKNEPAGLCGNEDCGQMSAWYVFSAMGFYPVNPVSGKYEIGTPLFPEMQLHLANGKTFTVLAPKVNKENIYIQSIKIDGKPYDKTYLTHEQIMSGATVEFEMSNTPKAIGVIFEENNP